MNPSAKPQFPKPTAELVTLIRSLFAMGLNLTLEGGARPLRPPKSRGSPAPVLEYFSVGKFELGRWEKSNSRSNGTDLVTATERLIATLECRFNDDVRRQPSDSGSDVTLYRDLLEEHLRCAWLDASKTVKDALTALCSHKARLEAAITNNDVSNRRALADHLSVIVPSQRREALVRYVTDNLAGAGIYRRDRMVRRQALDDAFDHFLSSNKKVFPVIGISGVGKTSALAAIAEADAADFPDRILLQGVEIERDDEGIEALIHRLICREQGGTTEIVADLSAIAGTGGKCLVVMLDGMDKADISDEKLRVRWIPNTLAWLERHSAKLLFSSRPERWGAFAEALPPSLIFYGEAPKYERSEGENDGTDKVESALESNLRMPFWLQDFTTEEAEAAVLAYGLQGRLSPEQATHPFILSVVETLGTAADTSQMDFGEILHSFIERRITLAVARNSKPSWSAAVRHSLEEMAARLLKSGSATITSSQTTDIFGRHAPAIDSLVEENLLTATSGGHGFQHDQVREYLQSLRVTEKDVISEIDTLPMRHRHDLAVRLGLRKLADTINFMADISRANRSDNRMHSRLIEPSVASFVILRLLRNAGSESVMPILDLLYESTDPKRAEQGGEWPVLCVCALISRLSPADMQAEAMEQWVGKLLVRVDFDHYHSRNDDIVRSLCRKIAQSDISFSTKVEFLKLAIRHESSLGWPNLNLRNYAWDETYSSPKMYHFLENLIKVSPLLNLANNISSMNGELIVKILSNWIEEWELINIKRHTNGRSNISEPRFSVIFLYYLRARNFEGIANFAVWGKRIQATELLEALAVSNSSQLVKFCLSRLEHSEAEDDHLLRSLWYCAKEFLDHEWYQKLWILCLRGSLSDNITNRVWFSRIVLALKSRNDALLLYNGSSLLSSDSDTTRNILELTNEAIINITEFIRNNQEYSLCEDYTYILEDNFDRALETLEAEMHSNAGLSSAALSGIRSFMSARKLRKTPYRHVQYKRIILLLEENILVGSSDAIDQIAAFIVRSVDHAGMNEYEFSTDEVKSVGILDLFNRLILLNNETVFNECRTFSWPIDRLIRDNLFDSLIESNISNIYLEDLVYKLCFSSKNDTESDSFSYLVRLRKSGNEDAWDEALARYISIYRPKSDPLLTKALAFWQGLGDSLLSVRVRYILRYVAEGKSMFDATDLAERHWREWR